MSPTASVGWLSIVAAAFSIASAVVAALTKSAAVETCGPPVWIGVVAGTLIYAGYAVWLGVLYYVLRRMPIYLEQIRYGSWCCTVVLALAPQIFYTAVFFGLGGECRALYETQHTWLMIYVMVMTIALAIEVCAAIFAVFYVYLSDDKNTTTRAESAV